MNAFNDSLLKYRRWEEIVTMDKDFEELATIAKERNHVLGYKLSS